jgi:hypothetical protein
MRQVITHLATFTLGIILYWFYTGWWGEMSNPGNKIASPVPVKISGINDDDKWINDFDLQAVPLSKIDSIREYVLLLIRPKEGVAAQFPDRNSMFVMKGFDDRSLELWFTINPSQISNNSPNTHTLLLDFGGSLLRKKNIEISNPLEVSSMDVKYYVPKTQ